LARLDRVGLLDQLCRRSCGPGLALTGFFVIRQKRRNLTFQLGIVTADLVHIDSAFRRIALQRFLEQRLDLPPALHY
jgi:hypothetical protein